MKRILLLLALALAPAESGAQPSTPLKLVPGTFAPVTPVVAHEARCMAQSDALGLLAFGHDRTWAEAHVTLLRLDAQGRPELPGRSWKLPLPDVLRKYGNFPLALAFHPTLPRLYVWQEIYFHYSNPPTNEIPDLYLFDHLLIYDLQSVLVGPPNNAPPNNAPTDAAPELLAALCRGPEYLYGQQGGAIAIDPAGTFLYVPNLRERSNPGIFRFGRFPLDADGLPDVVDAKRPLPERRQKLAEWAATQTGMPPLRSPIEYVYLFPGSGYGSLMSVQPVDKDLILCGCTNGVVCWRPNDPLVRVSGLPIGRSGATYLTRHPRLPLVFASKHQGDTLYRVDFVDGYWTLVPRGWTLPEAKLTSPPVLLSRSQRVAIGGQHQLYLVPLDDQGQATEATVVRVFGRALRTLAYSERFDRLYVGADLSQ